MRRLSLRYFWSGALLAGFAMLSEAGCTNTRTSVFVRGVLAQQAGSCVAKADTSSPLLLEGVLDLAFRTNYEAVLLVGNQMVAQASHDQLRVESDGFKVEGAVVTDQDAKGNSLASYQVPAYGYIDPGSGSTPSYGVVSVQLIPDQLGTTLTPPAVVTADVYVFGHTIGGSSLDSADLLFPIQVCYGCLVSFPADALDPTTPGRCVGQPSGSEPCTVGQDDPIDCRFCATDPVCKPPP